MKGVLAVAAWGVLLAMTQTARAGTCDEKTIIWNGNVSIVDNDPAGATVVLTVPTDGCVIGDLDVGMIITHTWQGDLDITLTDPNGLSVELMNRPGTTGPGTFGFSVDNFGTGPGTDGVFIFDDEAAMIYDEPQVPGPGIPDVGGAWQPENVLSAFDGRPKGGNWEFRVTDNAPGDLGEIRSVSLSFLNVVATLPSATGWQSCALHDPAGAEGPPTTWCLDVVEAPPPRVGPPDPRADTQIEPRAYATGGTTQPFVEVVIELAGPPLGAVTVDAVCTDTSTHGAAVTVSTDGLTVTAMFDPPLPNTECCTMTLGGGATGSQLIKMLEGDVNGSGRVNATDKNIVKQKVTARFPPLAGDDFFSDVNMSGRVNSTDKNIVKGRITSAPEPDAGCP